MGIKVRIYTPKKTELLASGLIPQDPTEYEYGKALADMLEPFVSDRTAALVEVEEDGRLIHALAIVKKAGSVFVTENAGKDTLPLRRAFRRAAKKLPERYLVCVNPEHNNNKYYKMVDLEDGTWGAYYGRVGEKQGESLFSHHAEVPYVYPAYMYYLKLQEKLLKGYRDVTKLHATGKGTENARYKPLESEKIKTLVETLMQFANAVVESNYTIAAADVTPQMVTAAKTELAALRKLKRVSSFNKHLLELMHILPRRIDGEGQHGVQRMLAQTSSDFGSIIIRESNLLQIMEGQIRASAQRNGKLEKSDPDKTILDVLGIEIYEAWPEQVEVVKRHLSDTLQPKLSAVYRVINKQTQKRFNDYLLSCKKEGKNRKVKQFWHGSENENWFSILQNGLLLNPNAKITGKMFGQGIYFAPSDIKSYNYTSARGSYWKNGTSNVAYMGLYATVYGTPYDVYTYNGISSAFSYEDLQQRKRGASCLHAHASNGMLRNDEVVFYQESQVTINYLCEFSA